jgi:hypothetical protein
MDAASLLDLTAPLSFEEIASLEEVRKGFMQSVIPAAHRDRLMSLGYVAEWTGGLALTNAGRIRLVMIGSIPAANSSFGVEFRRAHAARLGASPRP